MPVTSTYRLQLHAEFTFADAARIVPYLARLGISHLYLSPILQAAPGSMHGYDVVDHQRVSADLGGREGFEKLAEVVHQHDLGIVVDVVPNHMALPVPEYLNAQLWALLRDGRDAETADWFDIDWKAGGGRIGLPILGEELDAVLAAGELVVDRAEVPGSEHPVWVLRYFDHVLPLTTGSEKDTEPGTSDADVIRAILEHQHYRLASWRQRVDVLNYRRFFEVDSLIAVRVEDRAIFDETHRLLLELNHSGLIDGFRIDHPDGLADPGAYLDHLRSTCKRGTPVWVEKILEGTEDLPTSWASAGTTGYDALRAVQAALVDTADADVLGAAWAATGGETLPEAIDAAKRTVVRDSLGPEVERLTRRASEVLPQFEPARLRAAIVELLVAGEVYRAYVRASEELTEPARARLNEAFRKARTSPETVLHKLEPELLALVPLAVPDDLAFAPAIDFSIRLQQTWGPVMAKGIEDTTFYRWNELIALNEVGGDPDDLNHGSPELLHRWAARQADHWPAGMTTLSTHDNKRSEDVRARILAVAGDPEVWDACSTMGRRRADESGIDEPAVHFVWQTLLGVGNVSEDRINEYLRKALREAKVHTTWVDVNEEYEAKVLAFADSVTVGGPLHDSIAQALAAESEAVRALVLGAKVLQLTLPGVADSYQGCEVVNLSLVDPDNRRPVPYDELSARLASLDTLGIEAAANLDDEKLWITSRLLRLRRGENEFFTAPGTTYAPLPATTDHVVGFLRGRNVIRVAGIGLGRQRQLATIVTRAPARLRRTGGWSDETVTLPEGQWRDVLSGAEHPGGEVRCADLFKQFPVSVLVA